MTDPSETANLVGQLTRGYREHVAAEAAAVPGRVRGEDIEDQAAELAAAAARLSGLLTAFASEPGPPPVDSAAVLRGLSSAAESMAAAAVELRQQSRVHLEPEAAAAWEGALTALRSAASAFDRAAERTPVR